MATRCDILKCFSLQVNVNTTEEISTVCRECQTTVEAALTQCNLLQLLALLQQGKENL